MVRSGALRADSDSAVGVGDFEWLCVEFHAAKRTAALVGRKKGERLLERPCRSRPACPEEELRIELKVVPVTVPRSERRCLYDTGARLQLGRFRFDAYDADLSRIGMGAYCQSDFCGFVDKWFRRDPETGDYLNDLGGGVSGRFDTTATWLGHDASASGSNGDDPARKSVLKTSNRKPVLMEWHRHGCTSMDWGEKPGSVRGVY